MRAGVRYISNRSRVRRYLDLAADAEVIHLQQTLNAFGSNVATHFLRKQSTAAKIVTLHELDPEQISVPAANEVYNEADAVIVLDSDMKRKLVLTGVAEDLIHVVPVGVCLAPAHHTARDGIVFYGGHHLNKSKGFHILVQAYRRLLTVPRSRFRSFEFMAITGRSRRPVRLNWQVRTASHTQLNGLMTCP